MKVLFDHPFPFQLAHGGFQIQIERTKTALEKAGVEVEYLRWWDATQRGDLIHYFSVPRFSYLQLAKSVHLPVVQTTLQSETCNRPDLALKAQALLVRVLLKLPKGEGIKNQLQWKTYTACARNIVGLQAEKKVLEWIYKVPSEDISLVPLGLSDHFLSAAPGRRTGPHLICTGTITSVKNPVALAQLARAAEVPILFVGKPYAEADPYWLQFKKLIDDKFVKYQTHVSDEGEMIELLQAARGFVLYSDYENWCLSAHEAAACGLPLLLPNRNWSRERFGNSVSYFPPRRTPSDAQTLRNFYTQAPALKAPAIKLHSWDEVAVSLKQIYEEVLRRPR